MYYFEEQGKFLASYASEKFLGFFSSIPFGKIAIVIVILFVLYAVIGGILNNKRIIRECSKGLKYDFECPNGRPIPISGIPKDADHE